MHATPTSTSSRRRKHVAPGNRHHRRQRSPFRSRPPPSRSRSTPYHTFPYFTVNHLGVHESDRPLRQDHRQDARSTLRPRPGTVDLVVETASLDDRGQRQAARGRAPRDEHLRSPDFFNVAEFPRMTLQGQDGPMDGGRCPAAIEGELTLLGVTKPVNLTVEQLEVRSRPAHPGQALHVRRERGRHDQALGLRHEVRRPGPVSDEIKLYIAIEAFRDLTDRPPRQHPSPRFRGRGPG